MLTTTQKTNNPSLMLNKEENERIFSRIGSNSTTSVVCVTQLYITESPSHNKWYYQGSGIVCLVRDVIRKSYFIRFISMDGGNIDMEQELYKTIVLYKSSNQFLAFEAHNCLWGLLFCEKSEFHQFEDEVQAKIRPRKTSKVEKNNSLQSKKSSKKTDKASKSVSEGLHPEKEKKKKVEKTKAKKSGKVEKPKLEISGPSNFVVVTHVGHDGITGIENMRDSDKWKDLINFLYGSSADITQEETSCLIDIVAKNGGIDKYANAIEKKKQKKEKGTVKAPKTGGKGAAPPPPTPRGPPVPAHKASAPPPPSPPPPPPAGIAPPPSAPKGSSSSAVASLHEQIHQGKTLKKVEINEDISDEDEEGILGALVNNLAAFRSKVKASSSEEDSDESGEGSDDW